MSRDREGKVIRGIVVVGCAVGVTEKLVRKVIHLRPEKMQDRKARVALGFYDAQD